jgi:hypothetical protein
VSDQVISVAGGATPEEVAAVVAVVTALAAASPAAPARRRSLWNAPGRQMRPRLSPGPSAWLTSTYPR